MPLPARPHDPKHPASPSKGERTAKRILDAAESLFADRGFDGTTLREIARGAGLREPGLYNHFASKQELYRAVLDRALSPMVKAMHDHLDNADPLQAHTALPSVMTDLMLEHPKIPALFQQALHGDDESVGTRMILSWLDRLFDQGLETLRALGLTDVDRAELAIQTIAMFNLTTGYFLSQRAFSSMAEGELTDPENVKRQKKLLGRLVRASLIDS
jgi:AcrR family transcriptional regulator